MMQEKKQSVLFTEGTIGSMKLKNRFVRSATRELLVDDEGRITETYKDLYSRLAKGGVGLIIPGGYYVRADGLQATRCLVADKDEVISDLGEVVEVVHRHGAKIVAQINHCGRQSDPKVTGQTPLGPSPVRDKRTLVKPRQLEEREIEKIIVAFGEASRRMKEAGFDGVQIHVAHGYLVNQFLSPYTNRRKDQWGGKLQNRMRFLIEIYRLVRQLNGDAFPILIKINGQDFVKRGMCIEETVEVCVALDELGLDAIEVSGGIGERGLVTIRGEIPRDLVLKNRGFLQRIFIRMQERAMRDMARFEEAYFLPEAGAVKNKVSCPVIAVGGMRRRKTMEEAIESGRADFVSMCRPFIRQPNLVKQMEEGNEDPISCTNCNRCSFEVLIHQKPLRCYSTTGPQQ